MPLPYVEKLAKEHHMSVKEAEAVWEKAKKAAGKDASYAKITYIFKKMMGERTEKTAGTATKKKKK